jgi:hypothetical protein
MQKPSVGRIVQYRLSKNDVARIDAVRGSVGTAHKVGNAPDIGDVVPLIIVRVWGESPDSHVNGQAFLDGNDTLWVTSVKVGDEPGSFAWPVII